MKTINIKCENKRDFFFKYITITNPFIGITNVEIKVFAELLFWNNEYKNLEKEERNLVLFNKITRSKILQNINISRASLDNQFTSLRKKGLLLGNTINPIYEIFYDTHNNLLIAFKI
jgi:hypothetical protein